MARQPKIGEPVLINLTRKGAFDRVVSGKEGQTLVIDAVTDGIEGLVCHVRDYRYPQEGGKLYQIWSLGTHDYVPLMLNYFGFPEFAEVKNQTKGED